MFRWIVLIACLLAAAVGLAVGVMNPEPVNLFLPGLELSLALGSLLVIVFVAGLVAGLLLFLLLFHIPSRFARKPARSTATDKQLPDQHA
jgi:uncharacterized membrane protein YciS (DUF1049 family)